jgi:dipeptidyl aminopeptidase/acylaminoacyl peptidase
MKFHRLATQFAIILAALVAASAAAAPAFAQSKDAPGGTALTAEQSLKLWSIGELKFSPNGERLTFVLSEPPKETTRARHIWILELKTRALRQFTNSAKTEHSPRWSPDGKQFAFLSNRGDFEQIYVFPADGGEGAPLTEGKRDIQSFEWSPDGKQIAFLAPAARTEAEEKKEKDKDDVRVVDRDDKHAQLWLMDAGSKKVQPLTNANWEVSEMVWAPGGDRLIISATDHPESDREAHRIYSVETKDGKMQELAAPRGPFGDLDVSKDGKLLAYVASRVDGPTPHDIFVMPITGGPSSNLTAESLDRQIFGFLWRGDGNFLSLALDGFKTKFYSISTDGGAKALEGLEVSSGPFESSVGGTIAFAGHTATQPQELWLWDGKSAAEQVSHFNESWSHVAVAKPELVRYKSFDGLEIEGALLTPAGFDGKSKLPLIVLVHGGPTGAWTDTVETWGQLLVTRGYAVFYPNIRGSMGYGEKFIEMNRGDWGGGDFRDVMAGVDYLIGRGVADPDRLGIAGWSYGGYMAEWAITQTHRFKAAVSGAGLANLASEFGTEAHPSYDEWFYGLPYEKMDGFLRSSPITYAKNARTPTLILQGETDVTDPIGQSQELYRALKFYGVPAELILYPREGHGLREEKHLLDRLNRIVAWFDEHLKP